MMNVLRFIIWWGVATVMFANSLVLREQNIYTVGPTNITRAVGENNVYIPCSLTGPYNPFWNISHRYYEAYSLPKEMITASYGLVITRIAEEMNGTTFQCLAANSIDAATRGSSVGALTVTKVPQEFQNDFEDLPYFSSSIPRIIFNHQHTTFNEINKTFAWKGRLMGCNNYIITSSTCDGMEVKHWLVHQLQNYVTISSNDLIFGNSSRNLILHFIARDGGGNICQAAAQYVEVDQSDVTQVQKVSPYGLCVDLSSKSTPYVVLPSGNINTSDCSCGITSDNYNSSRCSCISETAFSNSLSVSKVKETPTTDIYEFCFMNLNAAINNSVIHFYESFRYCTNEFQRDVDVNFRRYRKSFQILVVLPNPPVLTVNNETGVVKFKSKSNGNISLDYYKVIVRDSTHEIVFDKSYSSSTNSTNIFSYIQQSKCSPFTVSVQAHNNFGYSFSNYTISVDGVETEEPCTCILQNVDVDLELVDEAGVQVNCSQVKYHSSVSLTIEAKRQANATVICNNDVRVVPFDQITLECDKSHLLEAYYLYHDRTKNLKCKVKSVVRKYPCSDQTLYVIIYTLAAGLTACLLFLLVIVFPTCICICRKTNRLHI